VLIVQSNLFNSSGIKTVVVAVITSNLALADAPGNVRIGKADSGLSKPSVVNVSQLITVDRALLKQRMRTLNSDTMSQVDEGLKLLLAV
jgi:mRNA interferase MazF